MTDTAHATEHRHGALAFRTVRPDDPAAAPMLADLEREYDARYGDHFGEPASTEINRYPVEHFTAPLGTFVLLYEDDRLVAGGAFKPYDDDTIELKRIWTAPEARGRGLAGVVVEELEAEAGRRGFGRVYLTTGPRQPEAVRLYTRLGYTPLYDVTKSSEEVGIHPFEKTIRTDGAEPTRASSPTDRPVIPLRHPLRWIAAAVVLVLLANLVETLFTNPSWEWPRVGKWLFSPAILTGLQLTLVATALSAVISFAGGIVVAIARLSRNPVLSSLAWGYVWLFRSVPLILVLVFLYNLGNLYPTIGIGVPFGPHVEVPTANVLGDLAIGVIGLSLSEIAYASEIVRAGVLAVDHGQHEAAQALGLPRHRQFLRIVLPQAMRSIVPAFVNQIVGLLKASSLLFYVSLLDLFGVVQNLSSTYPTDIIPLLVVATLWYLALTSAVSVVQYHVERWTSRGSVRTLPPTPLQRVRAAWRRIRTGGSAPVRSSAPAGRLVTSDNNDGRVIS
ncbi:polar amino acid transport system permease protein [Curtobacterium sp. 9128]|uniref:GNAT family N-acetyltransferase n=1 Tax=Curtobacterium sp. 9128 TaxID=1793722 RepID=UPI0007D7218F|nr:GNAT family N-acetyltransferase [Curtobacterium sp. 9128]SBN63270.1 polar amino acid transport system permease protein [Curtobacterium sp. 9128]